MVFINDLSYLDKLRRGGGDILRVHLLMKGNTNWKKMMCFH